LTDLLGAIDFKEQAEQASKNLSLQKRYYERIARPHEINRFIPDCNVVEECLISAESAGSKRL